MRDDLEEPAARDRLRVAGYDPEAGTVPLTGKKACPVLEGDGVPTLDGARGLAESMLFCAAQ